MKDIFELILNKFKPLIDNASYRVNNPLGAAFIFSWIIINWQAIYYFIFSDKTSHVKIEFLRGLYLVQEVSNKANEKVINYSDLIWWPLLLSTLYIVLGPIISNLATAIWTLVDKNASAIRLKLIQQKTFITIEERDQMYQAFEGVKSQYNEEINKLETEIRSLRKIASLQNDIKTQEHKGSIESEVNSRGNNLEANYTVIGGIEAPNEILTNRQDLYEKVFLKSNTHAVEQWIAQNFDLSVDHQPHLPKISNIKGVIGELLTNITMHAKDIRLPQISVNKTDVTTLLLELKLKGLVKVDNNSYKLTDKAIKSLENAING